MAKLSKQKQNEMIKTEKERLNEICKDLSEDKKRKASRDLIARIAFMTITLEILEDEIKTKGPTYLFKQGAQQMLIESPSQKSYNAMINRYTSAYDKLFSLLPKDVPKEESDGFDEFINGREDFG